MTLGELQDSAVQLLGKEKLYGISLGVGESEYSKLKYCRDVRVPVICLDIAHGHSKHMLDMVKRVKDTCDYSFTLIAGNVATENGTAALIEAGADIIKIGLGGGSLCSTRVYTGHGIPQFSCILECASAADQLGKEIIADGGIRSPGDAAKALAAGATYVMMGRAFAPCAEAPGERKTENGRVYKKYMGMASIEAQESIGRSNIFREGESTWVPVTKTASDVITEYSNGLRSALSYTGAMNMEQFQNKAQFIKVSRASYLEGLPHGLE